MMSRERWILNFTALTFSLAAIIVGAAFLLASGEFEAMISGDHPPARLVYSNYR